MTDLTSLTLAEARAGLASKSFTSLELTDAHLRAIEAARALNAFVMETPDQARAMARAIDARIAKGEGGPLAGIPLGIKDLFATKDVRTTACSKILGNFVPTYESTVTSQLWRDGAVMLGKLNNDEFAMGSSNENSAYGPVLNPRALDRVPGGSSGGSAAAVAAGFVVATLGSDTGGSIRLPAANNGIVGMKATYGRITRHGAIARSWSLDHFGPMTRTARDCALMLQVVAGHDPRDATSSSRPVPDYLAAFSDTSLAGIRIGIPEEAILREIDPEIMATMEATIRTLESLGATTKTVQLPNLKLLLLTAETIIKSEAATMHRRWLATRPQHYASQVRLRLEVGFVIPATQYIDALRLRAHFTREFLDGTMGDIDMLHLPVMPFPVPTIADTDVEGDGGEAVAAMVGRVTTLTRPFNFLGVPALSVPAGFCAKGLPIGLQFIGHPFDEGLLLRIAHAFQSVTEFHRSVPEL